VERADVHRLADQAQQMGCFLFGLSSEMIPHHFSPQAPFRTTGMVDGGKSGFLPGSKLWWPEDIAFADDIWISALNAHEHRKCLIDDRYVVPTMGANKGGLADVRTTAAIWRKASFLTNAFGEAIEIRDEPPRDVVTGTRKNPKMDSTSMSATYPWRLRLPWS
jgi:hypothetical protein